MTCGFSSQLLLLALKYGYNIFTNDWKTNKVCSLLYLCHHHHVYFFSSKPHNLNHCLILPQTKWIYGMLHTFSPRSSCLSPYFSPISKFLQADTQLSILVRDFMLKISKPTQSVMTHHISLTLNSQKTLQFCTLERHSTHPFSNHHTNTSISTLYFVPSQPLSTTQVDLPFKQLSLWKSWATSSANFPLHREPICDIPHIVGTNSFSVHISTLHGYFLLCS